MLAGHLIRRVGIEGRFGAELVGEGDLLRPWRDEHDSPMLPLETGWTVVNPARVAILDESFNPHLASYPELCACLVGRAVQRARYLAVQMAIIHQPRVDKKLHMLLWHLAGRWGRVRPEGTILRLRLTHQVLAELVAARRQTVTSCANRAHPPPPGGDQRRAVAPVWRPPRPSFSTCKDSRPAGPRSRRSSPTAR